MTPDRYDVLWCVFWLSLWGGVEFVVIEPSILRAVRVALLVGVIGSPVIFYLYHRGLAGDVADTMRAIGYNFGYKALILVVTPFIVGQFTTIHYVIYESLLFFMLFSLNFLAIYHVRKSG